MQPPRPNFYRNRGFAAAGALFAIGLFVLIGSVAATAARTAAKAKVFHETKESMIAQSELIGSNLVFCRTLYPNADNLSTFHLPYPATPADSKVASLVCPGSGLSLWSGDSRSLAPRTLAGFSQWNYVNDAISVRITTTAVNANAPYYQDLMDAVITKVGSAQASRTGDTLTVTLVN